MTVEEIVQNHNRITLAFYHRLVRYHGTPIQLDSLQPFQNENDFNPMVQAAFLCNQKTTKSGTNRMPYMLHPLRVALLVNELVTTSQSIKESLLVGALLHDCIEEGDGDACDILSDLQAMFPCNSDYPEYAIILTEPQSQPIHEINKIQYLTDKVSLIKQVLNSNNPLLINVLMADLLDSLICYLFNNFNYKQVNTIAALLLFSVQTYRHLLYPDLQSFISKILSHTTAKDKLNWNYIDVDVKKLTDISGSILQRQSAM